MLVKESKIHGLGCFVNKDFKKGEVIDREMLPELEAPLGNPMEYLDDSGQFLDLRKSDWRYLNHQHDNNAEWYSYSQEEPSDVCLIAERDIKQGEEITINYRQEEFS